MPRVAPCFRASAGAEWHTHVFLYIYFLLIILCRSDDEENCDEEYYDTQRGVDNHLVLLLTVFTMPCVCDAEDRS